MKSYEIVFLTYNTESRDPNNLRIETIIIPAKSKTIALQQFYYDNIQQLKLAYTIIRINKLKNQNNLKRVF